GGPVDTLEPLVQAGREVAYRRDRAHQRLAVLRAQQSLDVGQRRLAGDREPAQRPSDLIEVRGAFRDPRVAIAENDPDEWRSGRARRDQVDAREPGHQVARNHRARVAADRRLAVDPDDDLDAVDVVARDRVLLHAADLHAPHVDVAAQLQAVERLVLEMDLVEAIARGPAAVREPDVGGNRRGDQRQHDRTHQRVAGFRLHPVIPPRQAFYGPRSTRVS